MKKTESFSRVDNPKVSIVVPIYNVERYLRECIDSILGQTLKDIELVLVNDGSTDGSEKIINEYASKDDRIVVVNQKNSGLSAARSAGFKASSGKYIGWVDADDFVKPEMYKTLYGLAEDTRSEIVYCDYEFFPHKVSTRSKWFKEYHGVKDWHFIDKNTSFCFKLFSRKLLERVDICTLLKKYGEYSCIAAMLDASNISFTREKLYVYRVGHVSMSGGSFVGKVEHYTHGAEASKKLGEMIAGKPYENSLREYFDFRYIYALLLVLIVAAKNSDSKNYYEAKKELNMVHYKENSLVYPIIKDNYGTLKALVISKIIPMNYLAARCIAKLVLK